MQQVADSQLSEDYRTQLLRRIDITLDETEKYIKDHHAEIELDEENQAVLDEVDAQPRSEAQGPGKDGRAGRRVQSPPRRAALCGDGSRRPPTDRACTRRAGGPASVAEREVHPPHDHESVRPPSCAKKAFWNSCNDVETGEHSPTSASNPIVYDEQEMGRLRQGSQERRPRDASHRARARNRTPPENAGAACATRTRR